uniref:G-protein coupled receptors family 1 profile domain-containing protein n=1 Tax=Plectus sambesii TaxID=2011161 RepID=A0A914XJ00_9BILA
MNDRNDEFLNQFYGPTAQWFSLIIYAMAVVILSSNTFLIVMIVTSKTLRTKSSNWFIVAFAMSSFLHGVTHTLDGVAMRFGSADNRLMCSIVGVFNTFTATSSFGFPFLIAADRYYKITIPQPNKFSLGHTLFKDVFIIPLIFGWFCFVAVSLLPLLLNNAFGEDTEVVPLVLGTVPMLLSAGQLFLPELPMWIKRVNVVPYLMSNAADPWLTIYSVRPIRHRISQLLCRSKDNATVFALRTPAANLADRRQTQTVNHGTRTS